MPFAKRNGQSTPAIAAISYAFPEGLRTVSELADERLLNSSAETMESFGFGNVHVALTETPYDLALTASRQLLDEAKIDPASVGLLIYGGTPGSMAFADAELRFRRAFRYPPYSHLLLALFADKEGGAADRASRAAGDFPDLRAPRRPAPASDRAGSRRPCGG